MSRPCSFHRVDDDQKLAEMLQNIEYRRVDRPSYEHYDDEWEVAKSLQAEFDAEQAQASVEYANVLDAQNVVSAPPKDAVPTTCEVCTSDEVKLEDWVACCGYCNAHSFCKECFNHHVRARLEERVVEIKCMEPDCNEVYDNLTIREFLDKETLESFEKVEQDTSVGLANVEGMKNCPRCPFAGILEDDATTFLCMNEACGAHTCLTCYKDWNEGHACDEDKVAAARRKIEEARSEAAISPCPRCFMKIAKSGGCNKLTCPSCKTLWCFECNATLDHSNPYPHFSQGRILNDNEKRCSLWGDETGQKINEKIEAADRDARREILEMDPTMKEEKLAMNVGQDSFGEVDPRLVPDHNVGQPGNVLQPRVQHNPNFPPFAPERPDWPLEHIGFLDQPHQFAPQPAPNPIPHFAPQVAFPAWPPFPYPQRPQRPQQPPQPHLPQIGFRYYEMAPLGAPPIGIPQYLAVPYGPGW
jgi:hypothetical protein